MNPNRLASKNGSDDFSHNSFDWSSWTLILLFGLTDQATDSINHDSGAMEVFVPPDDTISIYMAAWSVDVDRGTSLAAWAQAFCEHYVASCSEVEKMSGPAPTAAGGREGILLSWDDVICRFLPARRRARRAWC